MRQRIIKLIMVLLALLCLLLAVWGLLELTNSEEQIGNQTVASQQKDPEATEESQLEAQILMPWEIHGVKKPADYTREEYETLTDEQKEAFQEHLGVEGWEAWLENTQEEDVECPWEMPDAKQPEEYSWEEYEALTKEQQDAFLEYLGPYGLESWLEKVMDQGKDNSSETSDDKKPQGGNSGNNKPQGGTTGNQPAKKEYPWDKPGAKQPKDYTWDEYKDLTKTQQVAFQQHLGSSGFDAWLKKVQEEQIPWSKPGAKQPEDYSWEEYDVLTEAQKVAFQKHLGAQRFEAWLERTIKEGSNNPWDKADAKQPKDYTWKEYSALTENQKASFQEHLGTNGFLSWLEKEGNAPWTKSGAKQPKDYTLKEYNGLTEVQQMAFRYHLGTERFETWLANAQNAQNKNPWEEPGAKQPKDYTMAEFEALTAAQQMAFQKYLGEAGFEAWLNKAQGQPVKNPWEETGAKQPKDYTLAEFEALTAAQQMAFQNYLGEAGFEAWLNKVQGLPVKNPWEETGAKQPKDYTLAEFEALTAAQQMAFQSYLGEAGFEAWLNKAQGQPAKNPWEESGAKQPENYSMAEFEALTAAQQMAFQNYLGEESFEAWLNRVAG